MAITLVSGRQEVISAAVTLTFDTLASDAGVAENVIELPEGAKVVSGYLNVTEAFDGGETDVLVVGTSADNDRFTATPVDLQTLGATALDLSPTAFATEDYLAVEWTAGSTGTATAGAVELVVEYVVSGRAAFSQG